MEAVTGQVWAKLPNPQLRPDDVQEETDIVERLEAMAAARASGDKQTKDLQSVDARRFSNIFPASNPAFSCAWASCQ